MLINPTTVDAHDWDISEDVTTTYPRRDRDDACKRALGWCRSQSPHEQDDAWDWETVTPHPLDDPEWLHIGNLIARNTARFRIVWHPETDGVRVERPHPPPAPITVPTPEPVTPEPIRFTVNVKGGHPDPVISVRLRFLPARGREDLTFPVIAMQLPPPPDAKPKAWEWTTWLAGSRMNVIELPDAFLTTPAPDRVPMIRAAVYALMRQIEQHRGRRH